MQPEITNDYKEKTINKIANYILNLKLESISILILDTIRPAAGWFVPIFMVATAPFLFGLELLGIEGWNIGLLLTSPENVEDLLVKIEQGLRE